MKKRCFMIFVIVLVLLFSSVGAFAAADPSVTIVNPAQVVYTDNLLISVKMTQAATIRVRVNEYVRVKSDGTTAHITSEVKGYKPVEVQRMAPEAFTAYGGVSYYSKQLTNIKPGAYIIYVDTIGSNGAVLYTTTKNCQVVESKSKNPDKIFQEDQSGTMNFFQSILNAIFGK